MRFAEIAAALLISASACAGALGTVTRGDAVVDSGQARLTFHLGTGAYDVSNRRAGRAVIRRAEFRIGRWASSSAGWSRTARTERVRDEMGAGRELTVECRAAGRPTLIFEARAYDARPYLILRAGLRNALREPIQVRRIAPMAGGQVYEGARMADARTLDSPTGAGQTRVTRDWSRFGANSLLVTFRQDGRRRSIVLGALRTADFAKSAALAPDGSAPEQRADALGRAIPGARLVAYDDCGAADPNPVALPARFRVDQGEPFGWLGIADADPRTTVVFDAKEVRASVPGLDPAKRYALGFSWWDYDENGRVESVHAQTAGGDWRALLAPTRLPGAARGKLPATERALALPAECTATGTVRVAFRNEAAVPNAVVSEVCLWELGAGSEPPTDLLAGRPAGGGTVGAPRAQLVASDPVGKRVDSGRTYLPIDDFYVDVVTGDPFAALDLYGNRLRRAAHARPNPYDFPTVCAWYAGVWNTPGAQNHPDRSRYRIATTAGLVEEMERIGQTGFLRYSRAACRIVPDNYTENNPQGWWDDEHWQREGFYVPPYETSRKWGSAMRARGGLAFTYFQPAGPLPSKDFRESHPEMLLGPRRILDYTRPAAVAHMRGVYGAMRGAIAGMMFDYCDDLWAQASAGGFADPYTTAVAFYRRVLRLAKDGLGPASWIHERSLGAPPADLAIGIVDSQRTSGDTNRIDPAMVSRSGLKWYRNRVVLAYDMDSKELHDAWKTPAWRGSDRDGRRMTLTMAYVAAARLLLANSFRDLDAGTLHDLERTFPYHSEPRSARPIDAFARDGWPRVYDFAVTRDWHQVTLFNTSEPGRAESITVPLSGDVADGALGLDPRAEYYAYDFWNDRLAGLFQGSGAITQKLRPGEARMLSVRRVQPNPQLLSTNRHIMQGYVDLARRPRWNPRTMLLAGSSRVVGGEPYRMVMARNGFTPVRAVGCAVRALPDGRLLEAVIARPANGTAGWSIGFTRDASRRLPRQSTKGNR